MALLEQSGFTGVVVGPPVDTFASARGEGKARAYQVYGHAFLARRAASPAGLAGPAPVT